MRTVRTRGPRRRGDNHNLVRSVPFAHQSPPPQPLIGSIHRTLAATDVADYEGISDTSWSSGTTGNYNSIANTSWNALYHHFVVANRRTDSHTYIMDPIRWSMDAPASSGGTYDWWYSGGSGLYAWFQGQQNVGYAFGSMAIVNSLMSGNSHAAPADGYLLLINADRLWLYGKQAEWVAWSTLNAISSAAWSFVEYKVHAIRHRVNGTPVGNLEFYPPVNPTSGTAWRIPCSAGDSYELDVWYEIIYRANPFVTAAPCKCCLVILQTRTFNGSRLPPASGVSFVRPQVLFGNVNFNPNYDRLLQSYEITKTGAPGWTLKGGTDGPHSMITGDGWTATFNDGSIVWTAPSSHLWIKSLILSWRQEIAWLALDPGPSLRSSLSWTGTGGLIYYRPSDSGDYWTTTASTDLGTITHSPCGVFDQAGTTSWSLVTNSQTQNSNYLDGKTGIAPINFNLPSSLITTRISR